MKTVVLDSQFYDAIFVGPRTLVGQLRDKVVILDVVTLEKSGGWVLSIIDDGSIATADVASDLVVIKGRKPALRRLSDGKVIARLPVRQVSTAAFGHQPLLFAGDDQRIWVWRLPSPEPWVSLCWSRMVYCSLPRMGNSNRVAPGRAGKNLWHAASVSSSCRCRLVSTICTNLVLSSEHSPCDGPRCVTEESVSLARWPDRTSNQYKLRAWHARLC